MCFKMALRNVRKSFKDYSIYFLTLTFAVCIFYCFNSITSQRAMLEISGHKANYIDFLNQILSGVSVFVSFILGSLILYGNNFLIRRRKKELGIYRILGMGTRKIAKLLFIETVCVGLIALGVGLLLGIGVGQGLSLFTLKMFKLDSSEYAFAVSGSAVFKAMIYFGLIFTVVMIFNTLSVSRHKLIDLLQAAKKSEKAEIKQSSLSGAGLIVSIIMIVCAYGLVKKVGLNPGSTYFNIAIGLGIIGTYGYFRSLTGVMTGLVKRSRRLYFKELNMFTMRQISSKMYTHVVSMTIICLMLFMTIGGLSTGLSFKYTLEKALEETTPYDASATRYLGEGEVFLPEKALESLGVYFEGSERYATYNLYRSDMRLGDLGQEGAVPDKYARMRLGLISISDFNQIRSLEGLEQVELGENEVLLTSNNKELIVIFNKMLSQNQSINIDEKNYRVKNDKVIQVALESTGFANNFCTVVVPDVVVTDKVLDGVGININYGEENREASEIKFAEVFESYRKGEYKGKKIDYDINGFMNGYTREQIYIENQGMTTIILYVGIYLGIVFLISSAAVLALQQLSEASESIERYDTLKRIGASSKLIDKAIFTQTVIYFMLPLLLAIVHALVGISVANEFLSLYGQSNIVTSSVITVGILAFIYGGYFYTTYTGYRNIVHHKTL